MVHPQLSPIEDKLRALARERILVLDGAMGTMIQALGLDEEGYRGARFDAWNREVRGNNDLLILSQPDKIRAPHLSYIRAGADTVWNAVCGACAARKYATCGAFATTPSSTVGR